MPTLLVFGPRLADGNRDSYIVKEDAAQVAELAEGQTFVKLTDSSDDASVWFRVGAIRHFWQHD